MYASTIDEIRDQQAVDLINAAMIMAHVSVPKECVFHITRDTIEIEDSADDRWNFYLNRVTLHFVERYETSLLYAADWRNEGWELEGNLKEAPETYQYSELEAPL